MMIIDASADALYRSEGSGAWRGRAFWLCLVHKMYGYRMYRLPGSGKTSGSEGSFRGKI